MRFSPDQLRDKALDALEEVQSHLLQRPAEKSKALRFALAYLATEAADETPFVEFWRVATGDYDAEWGPQTAAGKRTADARMHLLRIYAELGAERGKGLG